MAGDEERGTGWGIIRSVMELSPEIGEREMCGERRWRIPSSHVLDMFCSLLATITSVWLGLVTKGAGQE